MAVSSRPGVAFSCGCAGVAARASGHDDTVTDAVSTTVDSARDATQGHAIKRLARVGLAARGVIYLLIGWLAWLTAAGAPEDTSKDQSGALREISQHTGGRLVLAVLAAGLAGYALWRLSECLLGSPDQDHGIGHRLLSGVRAVAYGTLAVTAAGLVLGSSSSNSGEAQETATARLMDHTLGRWVIAAVGLVVIGVGVAFIRKGVLRTFLKHFALSGSRRRFVVMSGCGGNIARGAVLILTGIVVIHAAWTYDAQQARGLDGALQELAQTSAGPALLYLAGIGLALFGAYGLAEARWRQL